MVARYKFLASHAANAALDLAIPNDNAALAASCAQSFDKESLAPLMPPVMNNPLV